MNKVFYAPRIFIGTGELSASGSIDIYPNYSWFYNLRDQKSIEIKGFYRNNRKTSTLRAKI